MDCFVYKRLVIWDVVVWKTLNGLVNKHQKKGRIHGVFGFVLRRVQRSTAFASVNLFAHMFSHVAIFSKCSCWKYSLILGISVMTLYCIHPSRSQIHFPDMLDSRCQKEQSTPLQEDVSKFFTTTTTTATTTTTTTTTTRTTSNTSPSQFNFTTTSTLEANWNMSREMFVGCVDVTAHCKPVHNLHPWYACSIDELCIGFTTDTFYFAHIYTSVDVSQVWFQFSIFQHHQLRHTDTPWHTIMFWGRIRSHAYGLWRSRFDFVAFCGEEAATIGIRFWLLDRVSIQSRSCKIHTISIILGWHRNPQLKVFWAKGPICTQSEWFGYSEKDYLMWPTIIWKGCIALRIFCTQILQICQRLSI